MKNMPITLWVSALCLALGLAVTAPAAQAKSRRFLAIAGGSVGGASFSMAGALARSVRKTLRKENIRISAESTEGQVSNAKLLGKGEYDLALLQNVIAADALNGSGPSYSKAVKNLTAVCALAPQSVQILARGDAGIKSISDFKGKRVLVGSLGSGVSQNAEHILSAWGLKPQDLSTAGRVRAAQAATYLKAGRFAAGFFTLRLGHPLISNLAAQVSLTPIAVEGPQADKLLTAHSGYEKAFIPPGTYKGAPKGTATVSVMTLLTARAQLEEAVVQKVLTALFANLIPLSRYHPGLDYLSLQKALLGINIPLHPGAAKFFESKGVKTK
jgi:TRAP transporter TAXI family solute receptor